MDSGATRRVFRVRGTVQGVGFRPFVFRAATELGLRGRVFNDADGVVIEAEGPPGDLDAFAHRLTSDPPPRARIERVEVAEEPAAGLGPFTIEKSAALPPSSARVSPDLATCPACLAEMSDPRDRRAGYPFINCTDCGPRYSIVKDVPYDRARTTMSAFRMCPPCQEEYQNPRSRRFHAQPNACPACGPRIWMERGARGDPVATGDTVATGDALAKAEAVAEGDPLAEGATSGESDAIAEAVAARRSGATVATADPAASGDAPAVFDPIGVSVDALRGGAIVAVKGLGGFHLACDAADEGAILRLRERKRRPHKPFAVMFPDLSSIDREAVVGPEDEAALLGFRRPIVLLPRRAQGRLPRALAPGLDELGVFLPYTPLHHLLMRAFGRPLVMTSGNLSEEPIAATNEDARQRLAGIADLYLLHDRDIHMRADDSVVRVLLGEERVQRRARGHVPEAISFGFEAPPLLAVGADLKNVLCLTTGEAAVLSQHIGDLETYEAQQFFLEVRANLERLFRIEPTLVAHDLHPGYYSTALARRTGLPLVGVQHHHAHVASCLAENERRGPVIGVAWDGTGYGPDGTVWGGEILVADLAGFDRAFRIRPVALPGGDAAVREPWRMAVSHLIAAGLPLEPVRHPARSTIEAMVRRGINTVPTSSAGRLFDAVSSLAGVCHETGYEGQAAIELEAVSRVEGEEPYPLEVVTDGPGEIDPRPLVSAVVRDVESGVSPAVVGGRFHLAMADAIERACRHVRDQTGLSSVALSGGCFQSRLLTRLAVDGLSRSGFEVLLHARVPPNDGGIALGQAAVAAWGCITRRGT